MLSVFRLPRPVSPQGSAHDARGARPGVEEQWSSLTPGCRMVAWRAWGKAAIVQRATADSGSETQESHLKELAPPRAPDTPESDREKDGRKHGKRW